MIRSNQRKIGEQDPFWKNYQDMANKVEKCLMGILLPTNNADAGLVHRPSLDSLLGIQPKFKKNGDTARQLSHMGLVLGRAMLLQRIIVGNVATDGQTQQPYSDSDMESLLIICERLHSVVLPQCYAPLTMAATHSQSSESGDSPATILIQALISDSLKAMAAVLNYVEDSIDFSKRSQLHRLLIRWMAAPASSSKNERQHPIARETVLSLLYLYVVGGGAITTESGKRTSFLSLAVKILFDARTATSLRSNLSALLVRILASNHCHVKDAVQSMVQAEFASLLKESTRRKKRKRSTTRKSSNLNIYDYGDIQAISKLVAQFRTPSKAQSVMSVRSFCQDLHESTKLRSRSAALLISYMEGVALNRSGQAPLVAECFIQFTTVDLLSFQRALVTSIIQSNLPNPKDSLNTLKKKASLCASALRFCATACEVLGRDETSVPMEDLCRLLSACTSSPFLPTNADNKNDPAIDNKYVSSVLFEAIGLLRSVGKVIPDSCPDTILQVSAEC
jgi:hypothetical protein